MSHRYTHTHTHIYRELEKDVFSHNVDRDTHTHTHMKGSVLERRRRATVFRLFVETSLVAQINKRLSLRVSVITSEHLIVVTS